MAALKFITAHELARRLLREKDIPIIIGQTTPRIGEDPLTDQLQFETAVVHDGDTLIKGKEVLYIDDRGTL